MSGNKRCHCHFKSIRTIVVKVVRRDTEFLFEGYQSWIPRTGKFICFLWPSYCNEYGARLTVCQAYQGSFRPGIHLERNQSTDVVG